MGSGTPLLSIHGAGGSASSRRPGSDTSELRFQLMRPLTPRRMRTRPCLMHSKSTRRVVGISAGARSAIALARRHPQRVAALILIVPASFEPANPVAIEKSHGSRLAFWLVNAGADFAWWTLEAIAPSVLIRFIGVRSRASTAGMADVIGSPNLSANSRGEMKGPVCQHRRQIGRTPN